MRRALVFLVLLAPAAASAAVLSGTVFRLTSVHLGGAFGAGTTVSSTRSVVLSGQVIVGTGTTVALSTNVAIRMGYLMPRLSNPSGGGVGGVDPAVTTTVQFTLPTGCMNVTIPAGTFGAPVSLSAAAAVSLPAAVSPVGRITGTSVAGTISAVPALSPRKAILVEACYQNAHVTGLDESLLHLAVLTNEGDAWLPVSGAVDAAGNRVTGSAARLGTWRVVELLPGAGLDAAVAFPNPLRPGRGRMTFSNLPAGARLTIRTFSGATVREFFAAGDGTASWDGLFDDGSLASSGTYFVFIEGAGGRRTMKVQVQR